MEDPKSKHVPDLRTEILADHKEIAETLRLIEDNDPVRLPGLLKEFHGLLLRHYKREEAPDGLFCVITDREPKLAKQVQELRNEHTMLLAELLQLGYRVKTGATAPSMEKGITKFVSHLREHERVESRILVEALSTGDH